jgi:hypothetical protein
MHFWYGSIFQTNRACQGNSRTTDKMHFLLFELPFTYRRASSKLYIINKLMDEPILVSIPDMSICSIFNER